MELPQDRSQPIRAHLGLWDAVSIIIGIVIGAGIYETPPLIFKIVSGPGIGLAVWAIAGFLCLCGALCYAELASTYPRLGGDYVYLTRAYGAPVGFLYGWAQLAVIQTGSIGMMSYVFADYAKKLWALDKGTAVVLALLAVAGLTVLNMLGVALGKRTQNILTAAKVVGLGGILVAGFLWGHYSLAPEGQPSADSTSLVEGVRMLFQTSVLSALVLVFLTYGGWNDAAFVAAELRNGRRNIPLALLLGTSAITLIYVLVNAAYLRGLGFEGVRGSDAVAAEILALPMGRFGSNTMCVLVMISALGAVNGLIFTSSRIYAALGAEHSLFAWLGRWHPKLGSPIWSLITQGIISLLMITAVGTTMGQDALDKAFTSVGLESVHWEGRSGFETLLRCTAPVFWLFFLLSGLSLFILRIKDRGINRSFSVPLFPIVPLIFCATCGYMLYGGILYAWELGLVGGALLLAGVPLYLISKRRVTANDERLETLHS